MINGIDFALTAPVQYALIASILFPIVLILITRVHKLAGCNALQFLLSFLITTIAWLGILFFLITKAGIVDVESIWAGFFLYGGMTLVYLEVWALLSRGYTLGLLLTFHNANTPLNVGQLASLYRGGEGLDWLIKHRVSGLVSAKMIQLSSNKIVLTTRGTVVAFLYRLSVWFFGLRYTG